MSATNRMPSTHIRTLMVLAYMAKRAPMPVSQVEAMCASLGWTPSAFKRWLRTIRTLGFEVVYRTSWQPSTIKGTPPKPVRFLYIVSYPQWFVEMATDLAAQVASQTDPLNLDAIGETVE